MDRVLFVGPLDRVLLLRTLPMLEGLRPTQLAAIAQHAQERHFERGAVLQVADQAAEAVHLIVSGQVEVERANRERRSLQPGDVVGFVEMLSRTHRLEARATVDTVTLELDWDAQLAVCEEHFPVVMQYISYLARRAIEVMRNRELGDNEPVALAHLRQGEAGLSLIDRLLVLSRSRAFSERCLDALAELAHHVTEVRWKAGEPIWRVGDPAEYFVLIITGKILCTGPDGERFERNAGATLGMYAAMGQSPRWHHADSAAETLVLRIELEPFMDILEDHFDLALDYLALLARNLIELQSGELGAASATTMP